MEGQAELILVASLNIKMAKSCRGMPHDNMKHRTISTILQCIRETALCTAEQWWLRMHTDGL